MMRGRNNRSSGGSSVDALKDSKQGSVASAHTSFGDLYDDHSSFMNSGAFTADENSGFLLDSDRSMEFSGLVDKDASTKRVRRVSKMNMDSQSFRTSSALVCSKDLSRSLKEVELTSDKLRFDSLKVCGREEERKLLVEALERVHSENQEQRELVLVHGLSGIGKTSLVETIKNRVNKRLKGAFVVGKFDLSHGDEPYSAIASACRHICGTLSMLRRRDWEAFRPIQYLIYEQLGTEIHLLSLIFSELLEVVDDPALPIVPVDLAQDNSDSEKTKRRLHFAFKTFLKLVADNLSPLVIVLDDVQWADTASLELLSSLASDVDNKKLLFICIYRSDEVDEDHPFSKLVKTLESEIEVNELNITSIEVGNLTLQSVNDILMELLSCENPERTFELAELCHRRTFGNAFFVLAFIRSLRDEQLLKFHQGSYQWQWDIKAILDNTSATKNVVELMKREIDRLPAKVVRRLSFAACLGSPFKPVVLDLAWEDIKIEEDGETELDEDDQAFWLSVAVDGGFIEPANHANNKSYQWIHDSVREAVIAIVPPEAMAKHKAALGKSLMKRLNKEGLEAMVFIVANLIHEGHLSKSPIAARGVEYAKLNLQAARKANSVSAFDSAAKYGGRGIDLLPRDSWTSVYELTLELYTVAAESEMSIGKVELVEQRFRKVISQKDRPLTDKIPLYTIMIYASMTRDTLDSDYGIELGMTVLEGLGVTFPKGKALRLLSGVSGIIRWKKKIKTITSETVASLPAMSDATDQYILRMLHVLVCLSFRSDKYKDFFLLGTCKMLSLTFERGVSDSSPMPFGLLAIVFSGLLGDFALADKVSTIAVDMIDRATSKTADSPTLMAAMIFGKPWMEPLQNSIAPLMRGYKSGLSCGDTDWALICNACAIAAGFLTGRPLTQIENDCRVYGNQAIEFKRVLPLNLFKMHWLPAVILMGNVNNLRAFAGVPPTTSMDKLHEKMEHEGIDLALIDGLKSILHCILGEHEKGAKLAIQNGNIYAKKNPGSFIIMHETFSRCLSLYAMARQSNNRKYKRHAGRVHKIIKRWRSKGNPNIVHFDILLDAERAAMRGKYDVAEGLYQNAKTVASRSGLVKDAALASERYGDFLLVTRHNEAEATYKFNDAIALYGELGAKAKVLQLCQNYSRALWPEPDEIEIECNPP